ncbi:MAG: hypothetical protein LC754_17965 [Acidobacteria bacterium]|nr:hypothetical protein [Acidobacteriota bacterium]
MKGRIVVVILLVIAAAVVGRQMSGRHNRMMGGGHEDTHENFKLEQGAQVEVRGINGPVEISTAESDTADVHIVRTANSQDDLDSERIIVEHTPTSLVVRGEGSRRNFWGWLRGRGSVRQQVTLILPRRVELTTKGINGTVRIGEVDGGVEVEGINGRVEVAQATSHSEVTGVNGSVKVAVAQLGAQGLEVKGINGGVEILLKDGLNADVNIKGLNGSVAFNVPNVTMQEKESRSNMRARIGTGGAPIAVKGVNGGVRFESAGAVGNQ